MVEDTLSQLPSGFRFCPYRQPLIAGGRDVYLASVECMGSHCQVWVAESFLGPAGCAHSAAANAVRWLANTMDNRR